MKAYVKVQSFSFLLSFLPSFRRPDASARNCDGPADDTADTQIGSNTARRTQQWDAASDDDNEEARWLLNHAVQNREGPADEAGGEEE